MFTPQLAVTEITLIPHPLDAWRAALNALIAVAPGTSVDIAWHLNDARERTLICRDFSAASQGEAKLIDRLMLISAGKLLGATLAPARNHLGLNVEARVIGDFAAHHSTVQPANPASDAQRDQSPHQANAAGQEHVSATCAQPHQPSQPPQPGATTPAPTHSPALPASQLGRS